MDGMNELTIGFSASASKQEQFNELMGQIMGATPSAMTKAR